MAGRRMTKVDKLQFNLVHKQRTFEFRAKDPATCEEWIQAIV